MEQDNTGLPNPSTPTGTLVTNEPANQTSTNNSLTASQQSVTEPKKQKTLLATTIICAILALAGIAFGVYEFLDSNQKSSQISTLENEVSKKEAKITELETELSNSESKMGSTTENETIELNEESTTETATEPTIETTTQGKTATIDLTSEIGETETTKVYKIGECTADGGTTASGSHFSVKCHVAVDGKEALISYHDDDNILRLSLPKE